MQTPAKKEILMIDDDEINNFIADEWIKTNYVDIINLTAYADAEHALDHLRTCPVASFPLLIMCDLKMPGLDGFEFVEWYEKEFYQQYPQTKIVILTSSIRKDDEKRVKQYKSVADFVAKLSVQNNFRYIVESYLNSEA